MDTGMRTYGDELVAVLSAATAVLSDLPARVHRLTGPDLDAVLPLVDRLAAVAAAGRFTITADAVDRGEVASSQAGSTQQWVADRCPSLDARDAGLVAKAVRELTDQSGPGQASALASALAGARVAVQEGRLSVSAGCVVASELRQLTPLLEPGAVDAVAAGLVAMGEVDGTAGVRRVRPAMLARYGLGQRLQDLEDRHRGLTVLSCGHDIGGGITEYRMRLNPEARAVVEAAINVLSAPTTRHSDDEDGVRDPRDPRTIDQRRGDALVQVCRRAVSLAPPARADPTDGADVTDGPTGDVSRGAAARWREGHRAGHHRPGRPEAPDPTRCPRRRRRRRHPPRPRDRPDGWPATAPSSRSCAPPTGTSCTGDETSGTSPPPRPQPCGCATGTAPSPAAPLPPPGATPTTCGTGSTADPPTSPTARSCANATTPSSTATG